MVPVHGLGGVFEPLENVKDVTGVPEQTHDLLVAVTDLSDCLALLDDHLGVDL